LSGLDDVVLARLKGVPNYPTLFSAAFPSDSDPFSIDNVINAIASFERTLISGNSPYDKYIYAHDASGFSASAQAGMTLFFSETCECYHCHGSFNFTDAVEESDTTLVSTPYHNTGLYNIGGTGAYPAGDTGLMMETGNPADMGKFRAPTLRNIVYTAPYFHDGSAATLDDVLAHYAAGGRTILPPSPNAGDGATSPLKGPFVRGFTLTAQQTADLLAFIESASDPDFVTNTAFSDPNVAQ
jgi:cytochrome c peroxidase